VWASLYQQRPAPDAGGMFETRHFVIVEAPSSGGRRVRYWDRAATKDGDWTVGVLMHRSPDGVYTVEDVVRFRGSTYDVESAIKATASRDGRQVAIVIEQDPGQAGVFEFKHYARALAGYIVESSPARDPKDVRARPFSSQVQAGNVRLVRAAWNSTFLDELASFPNGKYDDQVDAAGGAFRVLAGGGAVVTVAVPSAAQENQWQ
jgi:predicted phage terminase large subunit-like protein